MSLQDAWKCIAPTSIEIRARDILSELAEANEQLPKDSPGIIHIGFEALGDDTVEQGRYEKIIATAKAFDRGDTALERLRSRPMAISSGSGSARTPIATR